MFIAEITLKCQVKADRVVCNDAVWSLLASLYKNGQILSDYFFAEEVRGYRAFVQLPEKNSLSKANDRKYVQQSYAELSKAGIKQSVVKILGCKSDEKSCTCGKPSSYILFTTFLDITSPVRCGDCFHSVPLYRIPPTYDETEYYDLLQWQADYQACDTLQMHCETGERFGTREISDLNSSLSKRGRKLCQKIEQSSQTPTYYYLYRSNNGRSLARERSRRCPGCGKAWLLNEPLHKLFDFRCDTCRLLSNISWNLR